MASGPTRHTMKDNRLYIQQTHKTYNHTLHSADIFLPFLKNPTVVPWSDINISVPATDMCKGVFPEWTKLMLTM